MNKVDLPSANPEEVTDDIIDLLGCKKEEVIPASAKTGLGIDMILKAIIDKVPFPKGELNAPLQALIFDSVFNPFRGIETYFKILNGQIKKGQKIQFMATKKSYSVDEIGCLKLVQEPKNILNAGDVGYLITGIKDAKEVKVGGLEQTYIDRFSISAKKFARTAAFSTLIRQLPRFILEIIAFGGIMLLILFMMKKTGGFKQSTASEKLLPS